jgi:mannose-6-phosphate isomerase-like protein (cupin superfamily)
MHGALGTERTRTRSANHSGAVLGLCVETLLAVDEPRAPARVHRAHDLTIAVLDGVIYLVADDEETVLTPGDVARVPAGTAFRRWNAGDDDARFRETFRPAASAADSAPRRASA